ncbi:MAG: hypothetical protein LBD79_00660 [Treponema sp.]|jgi:hypothetical protein|nr:hypothetical protein [Treponema sp.]
MSVSVDWREISYNKTLEQELLGLERRRASDPNCTIEDIEGILYHLYILEGDDWLGRGEAQDITMSATIAAYESFIARWKKETEPEFL